MLAEEEGKMLGTGRGAPILSKDVSDGTQTSIWACRCVLSVEIWDDLRVNVKGHCADLFELSVETGSHC